MPDSQRPLLIFLNRRAHGGNAPRRLRALLRRAPGIALRSQVLELRSISDVQRVLERSAPEAVPVAAGGDGTINLVVRVLRELGMAQRPLAVLPLGTGNAFAHAIGSGSWRAALDALMHGCVSGRDLMLTTHPLAPVAVASLSAGFEAAVIGDVNRAPATGILAGARALHRNLSYAADDVALEIDRMTLLSPGERVFNAGLYVIPCFAFGWSVLPPADGADGRGEAVVSRTRGAYLRFLAGPATAPLAARSSAPEIRSWRTATIGSSTAFQVDGEAVPPATVEVRIEPCGLRVLTPRLQRAGRRQYRVPCRHGRGQQHCLLFAVGVAASRQEDSRCAPLEP